MNDRFSLSSLKRCPKIETRLATPTDASAIAELHTASWVESLGAEPSFPFEERIARWNTRLSEPTVRCLVAESDGDVIGFTNADVALPGAELTNVYVHPLARRLGVARTLIHGVTDVRGVRTWRLWVEESSVAIALYRQFGFSASGKSRPDNRGIGSRVLVEFIRTEPN